MELLLATVLFSVQGHPDEYTLSCEDGRWILEGIAMTDLTQAERSGLLLEVVRAMPNNCDPDDYTPYVGETRR